MIITRQSFPIIALNFITQIAIIDLSYDFDTLANLMIVNYTEFLVLGIFQFPVEDKYLPHYNDVIMNAMASQIAGVSVFCSTVCAGLDQRNI